MTNKKNLRTSYILTLLEQAGATGRSVTEIFELTRHRFKATRKTIERDLISLSLNYPIMELQQYPVKFCLSGDYKKSHELKISEQDIQTILISLSALRSNSTEGMRQMASEAESNLLNALPVSLKDLAYNQRHSQTSHHSFDGRSIGGSIELTKGILESLRRKKCIQLKYQSPYTEANERIRNYSPYFLELTGGTPYLIALDLNDNKIKKLRLNRISQLEITDNESVKMGKSDFAKYSRSFGGVTVEEKDLANIEVTGSLQLATYFQEKEFSEDQRVLKIEDELYKITFRAPIHSTTIRLLLSLASQIYSIKPAKLKREVLEQLETSFSNLK